MTKNVIAIGTSVSTKNQATTKSFLNKEENNLIMQAIYILQNRNRTLLEENEILIIENQEIKRHNHTISTALQSFINLSDKKYEEEHDGRSEKNRKKYYYLD